MTHNKIAFQIFLIFACLFIPCSLQAMNRYVDKNPEFVFAVFATHRSRASLLDKANELGISAYIVNWQSRVDLEKKCIKNVQIRAGGQWFRRKEVPLPDVIYDFGVYKGARKRKELARALKAQLAEASIPFINPEDAMDSVNDKFRFARLMHKNQISHPETLNQESSPAEMLKYRKSNLNRMLDKHDLLFVKPSLGSKGYGIIIVKKNSPELYSLSYKIRDDKKRFILVQKQDLPQAKVKEAIKQAQKELRTTNAPYIIQEGINIYRYQDLQTDFRVNVQRGRDGELKSTGLMMRVGGNLSQGGRPADYRLVIKSLEDELGLEIEAIKNNVVEVAINTHLALEKLSGRVIGDLGMDVVIDDNGNPYIIEANTKSGYPSIYVQKNPLIETLYGLPPALELCVEKDQAHEINLLEYARHLVATTASVLEK